MTESFFNFYDLFKGGGIVLFCCYCKKRVFHEGEWHVVSDFAKKTIEEYEHVSHSICSICEPVYRREWQTDTKTNKSERFTQTKRLEPIDDPMG